MRAGRRAIVSRKVVGKHDPRAFDSWHFCELCDDWVPPTHVCPWGPPPSARWRVAVLGGVGLFCLAALAGFAWLCYWLVQWL